MDIQKRISEVLAAEAAAIAAIRATPDFAGNLVVVAKSNGPYLPIFFT
jgi:hypothetical protein